MALTAIKEAEARQALPSPQRRREIREAAGLSLQRVGDDLGVTAGAVALWETSSSSRIRGENVVRYVALLKELEAVVG
jgi:transcriptional regulator with XRE-family HTH domain